MSISIPQVLTRLALAGLTAAPFVMGACQSSGGSRQTAWFGSSAKSDSSPSDIPYDDDDYGAIGYRRVWRGFPIINTGASLSSIDVLGDVLAVQDSSSQLTVLDAKSGSMRWSDQLAGPLTKFVGNVRDGNRLVASSDSEAFFLTVDTGTLVDRHNFGEIVSTKPLVWRSILVYAAPSGHILGRSTSHDMQLWSNSLASPIVGQPVLIGNSGLIAAIDQSGFIVIAEASSGMGLGRAKIDGGVANGGGLAASDTMLFVASLDQSLYGFEGRSARRMWRVRTESPIRSQPVYHDGRVYCDIAGLGLTAFNAADGKQEWNAPSVAGTVIGMRNSRLLVWNAPNQVIAALDPNSGQIIERVVLEHTDRIASDAFSDGTLYLASKSGVVTKLVPR